MQIGKVRRHGGGGKWYLGDLSENLVDQSSLGEELLLDVMPIAQLMLGIHRTEKLHRGKAWVFSPMNGAEILLGDDVLCHR